jgi:hypothetical protein
VFLREILGHFCYLPGIFIVSAILVIWFCFYFVFESVGSVGSVSFVFVQKLRSTRARSGAQ